MTTANLFRWADSMEQALCQRLNKSCGSPVARHVLVAASRLGDGIFWYCLILSMPVVFGEAGLYPALRMAVAGFVGVAVYKYLKSRLVRERPFLSFNGIVAGAAPLDRYSFPSGHTLHAVSFTLLATASFPSLAWVLVPFAALVAASRVVLGLHYPSDVVAGGLIGAGLAFGALRFFPL